MRGKISYKLVNAVLFQIAWFVCILCPTQYALGATTLFLIIHLKSVENSDKELKFIVPVAIAGYCLDNIYMMSSSIDLTFGKPSTIYLVCVWILFASTLKHSMAFFMNSAPMAGILGAIAPISYLAVQKLEKVKYSEPLIQSILIHALLWSVFMLIVHKSYFGQNIQCQNER